MAAAAVPGIGMPVGAPHVSAASRSPGPESVVPERVPERLTSLPFESQEIGGLIADRMRINLEGRLLHIDEHACPSGFVHRDTAAAAGGSWPAPCGQTWRRPRKLRRAECLHLATARVTAAPGYR